MVEKQKQEMRCSSVIVIGGDHYNTLWLVRSLGFCNISPDLIIFEKIRKSFVCHSRYVNKYMLISDETELLSTLLNNSSSESRLILSSSDLVTSILDANYEILRNNRYILSNVGEKCNGILYWMNKANILEIASRAGLNITHSKSVSIAKGKVGEIIVTYPCLLKPQNSLYGHKTDFRICYNRSDLDSAIESLRDSCNEVLIQDYLDRDFEFVVNGIRYNGQHIIPGVIRKIKVGEKIYKMGMTTIAFSDPNVDKYIDVSRVKKMMDIIGYEGIYSIEFIVSKGVAYLLEINFRSDATLYISTAGGCNLPALLYNLVLGMKIKDKHYSRMAYGMAEISYMKELPWKKPWKIFIDLCKIDIFSIFMLKDIKPFFYKFYSAV